MENVGLETCETYNLKTSPLTSEGSESSSTFQDGEIAPLTSSNGKMVLLQTKNSKRGSTSLRCKDEDIVSTNAPDESVESLAVIPVRISETLKRHLEEDYFHVTKKRRLIRVPAEPNAISVLEDFVRHYGKYEINIRSEGRILESISLLIKFIISYVFCCSCRANGFIRKATK